VTTYPAPKFLFGLINTLIGMLDVDWLACCPFILGSLTEFYFKSGDYEALAVLPEGS
jgi:hypothetical protein